MNNYIKFIILNFTYIFFWITFYTCKYIDIPIKYVIFNFTYTYFLKTYT